MGNTTAIFILIAIIVGGVWYWQAHPDFQQNIKDVFSLKGVNCNYFQTSKDCTCGNTTVKTNFTNPSISNITLYKCI